MMSKGEKGYSLVELLLAVFLTAMVAGVLATSVSQFITISGQGTSRLVALDEVQNTARWLIRDIQSAYNAGTQPLCSPCTELTLQVINTSGSIEYTAPSVALGHVFGTFTYEDTTTITYTLEENTLFRTIGSTRTAISNSVTVSFEHHEMLIPGTRTAHYVTVDISSPVEDGDDVVEQIHAYLKSGTPSS